MDTAPTSSLLYAESINNLRKERGSGLRSVKGKGILNAKCMGGCEKISSVCVCMCVHVFVTY